MHISTKGTEAKEATCFLFTLMDNILGTLHFSNQPISKAPDSHEYGFNPSSIIWGKLHSFSNIQSLHLFNEGNYCSIKDGL